MCSSPSSLCPDRGDGERRLYTIPERSAPYSPSFHVSLSPSHCLSDCPCHSLRLSGDHALWTVSLFLTNLPFDSNFGACVSLQGWVYPQRSGTFACPRRRGGVLSCRAGFTMQTLLKITEECSLLSIRYRALLFSLCFGDEIPSHSPKLSQTSLSVPDHLAIITQIRPLCYQKVNKSDSWSSPKS